ncbi:MAG: hypothetical protein AAFY03_05555 [Pseudomonadota bacterium]
MKYERMFTSETAISSMADEIALIDELLGEKNTRRTRYERTAAYRTTKRI